MVTKLVERNVTLVQEHNKGKILKCREEIVLVEMLTKETSTLKTSMLVTDQLLQQLQVEQLVQVKVG